MELDKIPEIKKAVDAAIAEAEARRDYAFTDLPERIGRMEVAQLTPRHLLLLFAGRSPFLCGGARLPEHIAQFLWIVRSKPCHSERSEEPLASSGERPAFLKRVCRLKYLPTLRAIERYVDRALMDRPGGGSGPARPPTASFLASLVHRLASVYHWTEGEILDLPIARIFQYLRIIDRDADPRGPVLNPLVDRARMDAWKAWKRKNPKKWAAHKARQKAERKRK